MQTGTRYQPRSAHPVPPTAEGLERPIQYVPGVGPHRAEILARVGVRTVRDLLLYFPREHQDRRIRPMREAVAGGKIAVLGVVEDARVQQVGRTLGQAEAVIKDGSAHMRAVWFKRLSYTYDAFSALKRLLVPGNRLILFGAIEPGPEGLPVMRVEDCEPAGDGALSPNAGRIVPVYPLTEGLSDKWLRALCAQLVPVFSGFLPDTVPRAVKGAQHLIPFSEAVRQYHFPADWRERDQARERLAFDEFFFLETALSLSRHARMDRHKGFSAVPLKTLLTPFKERLGYTFTRAQTRAINEIFRDMAKAQPMYRLLQGDVGSGKTVVALSAALLAVENGRQTAFLAPTEILAAQHALLIERLLSPLGVRSALLTGSTPPRERKAHLSDLRSGSLQVVIGTHAILHESVQFQELGLVIIDEQHRFGVRQREKITKKAAGGTFEEGALVDAGHPDVLVMTATPIPRTLALTLYGDLDVSVLDEMPPGRAPIATRMTAESGALDALVKVVAAGQQVYVVLPLIDEPATGLGRNGRAAKSAKREYARFQERFPALSMALLHGQMPGVDKSAAMNRFREGSVGVLISTPVIEVGIDVPNATLIVIMSPERFGLAQLHQLRGRVGRGAHPSTCVLVVDDDLPDAARKRLSAFCAISDGFDLAEEDLRMRGPGEFLGEAQHGLPFFKVGDLIRDGLLISRAREAARTLSEGSCAVTMPEFVALNNTLRRLYGRNIQLSRIG